VVLQAEVALVRVVRPGVFELAGLPSGLVALGSNSSMSMKGHLLAVTSTLKDVLLTVRDHVVIRRRLNGLLSA